MKKSYNYIAIAALVLLTNALTFKAASVNAITPKLSTAIAQSQKTQDRSVIPGKKVGSINKKTTRADLVKLFGASRLKDETTRFFGGDAEFPGTVIELGKERSLTVLWKDKKRTKISGVMINDPQWKTPEGVGVGTTLNQLRKKFGEFKLSGFSWDYGGIPQLSTTKFPSYRNVTLRMDLDENAYQKYPKETQAVSGDVQLSSKDPRLQRLGVRVYQMILFFE